MVRKELIAYGLGYSIFFLFNTILTFLINKFFHDHDIGKITYTIGIITILSSVFTLCSSQAHLRFYKSVDYGVAETIRIISLLGTFILFIVSYLYFKSIHIAFLSFIVLFNERLYFYRSRGEIRKFNNLKIGWCLVCFFSIFLMIVTSTTRLNKDFLFFVYGTSYLLFGVKWNDNFNLQIQNKSVLKKILVYTLPILLTEILTWSLGYLNQIIINKNFDALTLTEYNVAFKLIVIIKGITSVFLLVYPQYYFQEADKGTLTKTREIRKYFIIILLCLTFMLLLKSTLVYSIIGASRFDSTKNIFRLLLISEVLRTIGAIYFFYRSYLKQTYWQTTCTFLSLLILTFLIIFGWNGRDIYQLIYFHLISNTIFLILALCFNIHEERKTF